MIEIWKDVKGYKGLYKVSDHGRIKSLKVGQGRRKLIMKSYTHGGYKRINLYDGNGKAKKYYIHRLVGEVFKPNPNPGQYNEINHIDGIKTNNHIYNLEWVTSKENQIHAIESGLVKYQNNKGRSCKLIDKKDKSILKFNTMTDASKYLGFNRNYIAFNRRDKGDIFQIKGYIVKVGDVNNV